MSTKYWLGQADPVVQVATVQITADDAATTYTLTIGGVAVSAPGSGIDVDTTALFLQVFLDAQTHPYFAAITWTVSTDTVTGTADVAGAPFIAVSSVSGGTGTMGAVTVTTAATGPNHWDEADNWSDGVVPVNADVVYFENSSVNVCWGVDQAAVDLASLIIQQTYTGKIGLDRTVFATSSDGDDTDATKSEYRDHYLDIGWDVCDVGFHAGPGSPAGSQRLKLNNDKAGASTTTIHNTSFAASETGQTAVRLLAAHASADVLVRLAPGGVGIAVDEPAETSTVGTVSISDNSSSSRVVVSSGVTLSAFEQQGGNNLLDAAAGITSVACLDGILAIEGDFTITTLSVEGGVVNDQHVKSSGNAVTTANLFGGTLDLTGSRQARTLATVALSKGATLKADSDVITITTLTEPDGPYTLAVT